MSMTDPIADLLTRIRNAILVKNKELTLPSSKMKVEIAKILKDEGYIYNFKQIDDNKQGMLNITLKYTSGGKSVITQLKRVSKPGCRIYCKGDSVPKALDGLGIVIVSTSKGILPGKQCKDEGLGGEVLCSVW
ncbi:MAG: 30S ribosomal protein S8 [Acidobacteriota bacterium]